METKFVETFDIQGNPIPQVSCEAIMEMVGDAPVSIQNIGWNSVISADFDNGRLILSPRVPETFVDDNNQILHELAHYVMNYDRNSKEMEGLHSQNWGLENPFRFWSGIMFDDAHPGRSQANTEARVWAWQHIIGTMCGLHDEQTFMAHPEIKYLKGEKITMKDDEAIRRSHILIQSHLQKIQQKHGDPQAFVREAFRNLGRIIEHEKQFDVPDHDVENPPHYEILSSTQLESGAHVEHSLQENWHSITLKSPDETDFVTICRTRDIDRAIKLMGVAVDLNNFKYMEQFMKAKFEQDYCDEKKLGIRFIDNDNNIYSLEEADELYKEHGNNTPELQCIFEDGSSAITCTNYAIHIFKDMPDRTKIYGFANKDNPDSRVAKEEIHPGGHDFALVDDRYLIDPWIKLVASDGKQICFDLTDPIDAAKVRVDYGPRECWTHMLDTEKYAQDTLAYERKKQQNKTGLEI